MKKVALIIVIVILVLTSLIFYGGDLKEKIHNERAIKQLNKAMEMSLELESASLETKILEGSYYPKDAPKKIMTEFQVHKPNKNKNTRNINFDITFYYDNHKKEVHNVTNYEGIYLNVYYPYPRYNKINVKSIDSIKINKLEEGTEYIINYKSSHLSRRVEWEYCDVQDDYEYFYINKDGVIIEYESDTLYKQKDENTSKWVDGESCLNVKLKDYNLLD